MSGRRRVVVTGLGAITPAGNDAASTWASLLAGRSSVAPVKLFEGLRSEIGAEVRGFDPDNAGTKQDMRRFARATQMTVAASLQAWRDAGFDKAPPDLTRAGAYVGMAQGDGAETSRQGANLMNKGVRAVHPLYVARCMSNAAPAHVSLEHGLRGPTVTVASACAGGAHAIGLALRAIQHGEADVMLAGGGDEMQHAMMQAALVGAGLVSSRGSRPFDRGRDGLVLGEGAALAVFEELEHAKKRGARIYAELSGFGQSTGGFDAPGPEAMAVSMTGALADAGWRADAVQYVNAEGASTVVGDRDETEAIKRAFGDHARKLAVSSTKSMIGHALGAAPAIGFVATALSIRDRRVHPTINYEERDPACDLDYVPGAARELRVERAMVNAFGFGGHCAALALALYH